MNQHARLACASPLLLALGLGLGACGSDDPSEDPDAAPTEEWQPLITGDWSLAAGSEGWYCASKTLDHDVYVGGFRPIDPAGTHHTVLSFGTPTQPDQAPTPCDPDNTNPFWVYASGVNTNDLTMPPGVGVVIEAGQQVHLNLHVFNTGTTTLTGTSGIEILPLDRAEVEHEAEMFLPGAYGFQIPPNQEYSYGSTCNITAEQHIFALFPHMHQLGRHFKTELTIGGTSQVLWDKDYLFDAQQFAAFDPITLNAGDSITTTCTWMYDQEPGGRPVIGWGNSSEDEMCFAIMMRYPRLNGAEDGVGCTDEDLGQ
jgi:copper type II ascorbate-dependent monooxygenase-like protein